MACKHWPKTLHFSHPFLGTCKVHQFLDLGYLEGTPFQGGIWAPYQYHHTVEWKTHTIPHSYQYHVTYHTIPYHTIPFDLIPYHLTSYHIIRGVWGPFTKYEKYFYRLQYLSVGLHFLWTASSDFCCHFKLQVEARGWAWSFENQLNWAYPRFWPFTLWIIHHKLLKIGYLARPFD